MTFTINKSAISEVRDQLSLDFADGEYLDNIAQNLGLHEHLFSFDDDIWRALVKLLALEYKQVATKFVDVMDLLFGPKVTQVGTPKNSIEVGDITFIMNDTSNLPQVGVLVFDEGLATEETLEYRYIDRTNNEVVLRTEFAYAHSAWEKDIESVILAISPSGDVVYAAGERPDPASDPPPFTVILDRGLDSEAVYTVTAEDTNNRTLTLSPNPFGLHSIENSTDIFTTTNTDSNYKCPPGSYSLLVEDSSNFPDSGVIKIITGSFFAVSADNSGASDVTVTFPASSFVEDTLAGCEVVFYGTDINGQTRRILSNTSNTITIDKDFTGIADYPRAGDGILIHPILPYSSNDPSNNSLTLVYPVPANLEVSSANSVELLGTEHKVTVAPVQYKGAGWDLIQSTPRKVELFIPEEIRDINDLRSASYLHDDTLTLPITSTVTTQADAGTSVLIVASTPADMPPSGTVIINEGNGNEEVVSYNFVVDYLAEDAAIGATSIVLNDSSRFSTGGFLQINRDGNPAATYSYNSNAEESGTVGLTSGLTAELQAGTSVTRLNYLETATPLAFQHAAASALRFYSPYHSGTGTPLGDTNQDDNTYPGGYLYSTYDSAPCAATTAPSSLADIVPGPSYVVLDQYSGRNVLEIENGLPMYEGLSLPFDAYVGRQSISISKVSLKNVVYTELETAYDIGDTQIEVQDLNFDQTDGSSFPEGAGYRIIIDVGTSEEEVCYVIGYIENPYPVLLLESPLVYNHDLGTPVQLLADVVTFDSPLRTSMKGLVSYDQRSTAVAGRDARFPNEDMQDYTAKVSPLLDCITLSSVAGWDVEGGTALLNFGEPFPPIEGELSATLFQGSNTLTLVDASDFPSVFPYEIVVDPDIRKAGSAPYHFPEIMLVTNKVGNVLTLSANSAWKHEIGAKVRFTVNPFERVFYNSVEGSDLCFANPIVLDYTHYPAETVISSQATSNPSTDGFDFPFRMPIDLAARLEYLIDLIRAAGIEVEIISKR